MKNDNKETNSLTFWQPFIITYAITLFLIIFTCVIHYNISAPPVDTFFYQVNCKNYFVFSFAKIAETLIPTTLTFGITLIVAEYANIKYYSIDYTLFIVISFALFLLGFLTPIVKSLMWLWILLFFVYGTIMIFLTTVKKIIITNIRPAKSEKSDGKFN